MTIDASSFASRKFDYLVVGGGTAGLVVAARLSENPNISVGVLEAGEYLKDMPNINIPGLAGSGVMHEQIDWCFQSVPQAGANNRVIPQPRGKALGGSSAINFLVNGRAAAEEYNAIENLGNPGWNWRQFLTYFKKSETLISPAAEFAESLQIKWEPHVHGSDGPLKKSYPKFVWGLRHPFVQALTAQGVPNNPEPGNGNHVGSSVSTVCLDPETVTRSYGATAYYEPNAHRKNLVVLAGVQATKVILEQQGPSVVATGVEYTSNGENYIATANREVILSAGSLKTPQILELSGIGKGDVLSKCGIQQVIDLPVGENLQEHAYVPLIYESSPEYETSDDLAIPEEVGKQMNLYQTKKEGKFTALLFSALAFVPLPSLLTPAEVTNLKAKLAKDQTIPKDKQFEFLTTWFDDAGHGQAELFHVPRMLPGIASPVAGKKYQSLVAGGMHPFSRGSVHIQSKDPLAAPAIDPAYFRNPLDLDIIVSALKFLRRVATTEPLASTIIGEEVAPGPEVQTDKQLAEYCRKHFTTMSHPLGSASMLPKEDGGVVDANLIVYGTKNLRVVDASIIPIQLSAHTQATVYAIAEKAADLIKGL